MRYTLVQNSRTKCNICPQSTRKFKKIFENFDFLFDESGTEW